MVQVLLAIHDPGMEVNGLFNYNFTYMKEPLCESDIHVLLCSVYSYMGWRQLGLYWFSILLMNFEAFRKGGGEDTCTCTYSLNYVIDAI